MRVALTGGGTGGHAYPAISIAEALRSEFPECELLFVGTRNSLEARLAAAAGIPFSGVTSRKLKRLLSPGSVVTAASLAKGFAEALAVLRTFRPDIVIGTGGYASAAVLLAQALRRGKILIAEADTVPGRTNLWLSRFASKICVGFEDSTGCFPPGKTVVTGWPIRSELLDLPEKEKARVALGLEREAFTILVLGGSQGARRLNEIVAEAVPGLKRLPVQVLHQVGERNYEEAERRRKSAGWERYQVRAYFDHMSHVYAAADLAVSRCGSSSVAELTVAGIPAILVPYPYSHADHQRFNAEFVARNGGGILMSEAELSADLLVDVIERLVASPAEIGKMAEANMRLGRPHAARDIAIIAAELIK